MFESLVSLKNIQTNSTLKLLCVKNCGLRLTHEDGIALQAIGQTKTRPNCYGGHTFEFTIQSCKHVTEIPGSIRHLANKQGNIRIFLVDNPNLCELGNGLSQLDNLSQLRISECPKIKALPWRLKDLPASCTIKLIECSDELASAMDKSGVPREEGGYIGYGHIFLPYFEHRRLECLKMITMGMGAIKLSLSLRQAMLKLYVPPSMTEDNTLIPGGLGYYRVKEHFENVRSSMH